MDGWITSSQISKCPQNPLFSFPLFVCSDTSAIPKQILFYSQIQFHRFILRSIRGPRGFYFTISACLCAFSLRHRIGKAPPVIHGPSLYHSHAKQKRRGVPLESQRGHLLSLNSVLSPALRTQTHWTCSCNTEYQFPGFLVL